MDFKRNISPLQKLEYGGYQLMDHFVGKKRMKKLLGESRNAFNKRLLTTLSASGPGVIREVERRSDLSVEEFKSHYIKKGIPVVLEGKAKEWACVKNWSLDYFKDLHGDDEIVHVDHKKIESEFGRLTLRAIIENIREGGGKYYCFYPLLQRHPEHIKDFDYQWLLDCRHKKKYRENFQVFMGGKGSYTPLHNAGSCNIFTQAYGEKEWMLYSSYYTSILDPDPSPNIYRNTSYSKGFPFNPFEPDFETFPLFKYIDGYRVHLKPGDVLWNPSYYWHAVRNLTDSIGVGYRWLSPAYCFSIEPLYFFLDLCVKNPSFWKANRLALTDINLIHLAQTNRLDAFLKEEAKKGGNSPYNSILKNAKRKDFKEEYK
jgi:hypothetical protein